MRFIDNDDCLTALMNHMRDDCLKKIVMEDLLIRRYALLRMESLGRKEDQKHGDIYRVSQAARTLARVVHLARESNHSICLDQLLTAARFDDVVKVAKLMSVDKSQPALNVGRSVGLLMNKAALVKHGAALREGDNDRAEEAVGFRKLHKAEWNFRVNSAATKQINNAKRNTLKLIPLTDDIKMLRDHIVTSMRSLMNDVRQNANSQDWIKPAKYTLSRLILFNKRRRGKVRDLKVADYINRPDWSAELTGEIEDGMSLMDQLLAKRCVPYCVTVMVMYLYFKCICSMVALVVFISNSGLTYLKCMSAAMRVVTPHECVINSHDLGLLRQPMNKCVKPLSFVSSGLTYTYCFRFSLHGVFIFTVQYNGQIPFYLSHSNYMTFVLKIESQTRRQ